MKDDNINWNLLIRYLNGETSDKENERVQAWRSADPENERNFLFLKKIWSSSIEEQHSWDAEASWARFKAKYPISEEPSQHQSSSPGKILKNHQSIGDRKWYSWIAAAAAMILIILGSALYLSIQDEEAQQVVEDPSYQHIIAETGSRTQISLSDGSNVILKPGSELTFPERFSKLDQREVELTGEAYFDVSSDPDQDFVVKTEDAITRVLGTRFIVASKSNKSLVEVAVASGRVALLDRKQPNVDAMTITENQLGVLDADRQTTLTEISDMSVHIGWVDGDLVFQQDSLQSVIAEIQNWYGIEIRIDSDDPKLQHRELTASFNISQPIEEVIEAIALTLEIEYSKENGSFYLDN